MWPFKLPVAESCKNFTQVMHLTFNYHMLRYEMSGFSTVCTVAHLKLYIFHPLISHSYFEGQIERLHIMTIS